MALRARKPGRTTRQEAGLIMAWVYLFFAGVFEIGWTIGLKYKAGFTRLVPTGVTVIRMIISSGLLVLH
jgi:quaternary ammonium compound-resistance protein SugE